MTFAGGPFNNFVLQSMVTLARRLRGGPSDLGLITTVSGMLSKPGLAVWSASPPDPARGSLLEDMAAESIAATPLVPVVDLPPVRDTKARVASFTVTFGGPNGLDPVHTAVVADLPDGFRTAATCENATTAQLALAEGLIGRDVHVKDTTFNL
jgi:acetyl-CoA C-acetyltransferase